MYVISIQQFNYATQRDKSNKRPPALNIFPAGARDMM